MVIRYNSTSPPAGFRRSNQRGTGKSYEDIMRMAAEAKANKVIQKSYKIDNYIPTNWSFSKRFATKMYI